MTWPTPPTAYTVTAWTDPSGVQWIYDASIPAWARYRVASTGGVSSFDDLTDVPAALTTPQAAATPSIRKIGTGATDAAAGNHTHPAQSSVGALVFGAGDETVSMYALSGVATFIFGTNSKAALMTALGAMPLTGGTFSGVVTLGENAAIALDPAGSADEKWTGVTCTGTAGTTVAVGDLLYLDVTAGEWLLADADAAATAGPVILGLCLLAATDGTATNILLSGTMRSAAFPASIPLGAPVYVSTTAGDITATAPAGTADIVRIVGHAITAEPNTIYFNPSQDWIELA